MRFLVLALVIPAVLGQPINDELNEQWQQWKTTFAKNFTAEENVIRRIVWEANLKFVTRHNLEYSMGMHTYTVGMNEFAHLTSAEFVRIFNGYRQTDLEGYQSCNKFMAPSNMGALPDSVDWRTKGYVTPVKNQEQCGSCWAFSTTGSLEGQHFKKTGKLVSLSEQNLMDCSRKEGNMGCGGGLMDQAFKYIKVNHGIDTEQCYPYKARDGQCQFKTSCIGATLTGCTDVKSGDEMQLQQAVATVGPVSVAIDAGHQSFQMYRHGVYTEPQCSTTRLDHGVLAVGYGTDSASNKAYWLVKNSWGDSWGMKGYINMARNQNNMCGIATAAAYPLV